MPNTIRGMSLTASGPAREVRRKADRLRRDLKTLAVFIEMFCGDRHPDEPKGPLELPGYDPPALRGRPPALCPACRKLLTHALVKRTHCPLDPKPACKKCPAPCYAPKYRSQIREIMRYSGKRMVLRGRLDYLLHLLF